MSLRDWFGRLAHVQVAHNRKFLSFVALFTVVQAVGITQIYLETDFTKGLPQNNPAIVVQNKVRDTFSGQDSLFILVQVEPGAGSVNAVKDIRDPRVIQMLVDLEVEVSSEPSVDGVQSAAALFKQSGVPPTKDAVKDVLSKIPAGDGFFNRDYTATTAVVNANMGSSNKKIRDVTSAVRKSMDHTPTPSGIKLSLTGYPPLRAKIGEILVEDAKYTIALASLIILILLIIINRPMTRGVLVFMPLVFGLTWTLGTMGWMGLSLSMVTVGVGAMILGLGVEYSVFFVSRYDEERAAGVGQKSSIVTSLDEVGTAIMGSSTTTIIGFLSLLVSAMPMLHDLGKTLALGIFYCVFAALAVNPAFIVFEEDLVRETIKKIGCKAAGGRCDER